jgi:hypothetical protein
MSRRRPWLKNMLVSSVVFNNNLVRKRKGQIAFIVI